MARFLTTRVIQASYGIIRREVHLEVTPRVALHDEPCAITASQLTPNSAVTLRAEVYNEKGRLFRSHAHYVVDAEGCLDLTNDPSMGGSYRGLYPMGLFVGLSTLKKEHKHSRLHRDDPFIPWVINLSIHEGHTKITDTLDHPLTTVAVERHLISPGVKQIPIKEGKVRGRLYVPAGPGPHPGIIDIYGGAGGLTDHRAALQASRGIASLAIAYFAYDDLPNNLDNVDLNMFLEAVDIITSHPEIIPDRCGIWASCQGALYGYMLADKCEKVKAVATVNGNALPYWTKILYNNKVISPPVVKLGSTNLNFDEELVGWIKMEDVQKWSDPKNKQAIEFGPGSLNARYMLIAGSHCATGGPIQCNIVKKKLNELGNDKVIYIKYEGAGHILEPPYSSFNNHIYNPYWPYKEGGPDLPTKGCHVGAGGTVEGNHAAMEDMWPKLLHFLNRHIKTESSWYQQLLIDSVRKV